MKQVVHSRIRGFISMTAHPDGCSVNVRRQIEQAKAGAEGQPGIGSALVVGCSSGYGLSSLLSACFGYGAETIGVCLERPSEEERSGSAGWYNLAEAQRLAAAEGRRLELVNGDAFSREVKERVVAALRARGAKLDLVVYSLAAPRRQDPDGDMVWRSVLKPIGAPYTGKSIDLRKGQVVESMIEPASAEEITSTIKVMGGEDWALWIDSLRSVGLLADGCRNVAYSYVGPESTHAIYRAGTIGRAKEDLEATARSLDASLAKTGGGAWTSINKSVVTQASAAIPGVVLYLSVLFDVMKARGTNEGPMEQIVRLFRDQLAPGLTPATDAEHRIRLDDFEMEPEVQAEVARRIDAITTGNLAELSDYAGWQRYFEQLFGFSVEGVDYDVPTELHRRLTEIGA